MTITFHTTANAIITPQLGRIVMGLDKPDPHYGVHPKQDNWRARHNAKAKTFIKRGKVDHYA